MIGPLENQLIFALVFTQDVEIHRLVFVGRGQLLACDRFCVPRIKEPAVIGQPGNPAELDPLDDIVTIFPGGHITNFPSPPIASPVSQSISNPFAIIGDRGIGQRDGPVFAQGIRIDQYPSLRIERIGFVQHTLVLQSIVMRVAVRGPAMFRQTIAFIIPHFL